MKYLEQFERIKRWAKRLEDQSTTQLEYEDFIWAFFQNAWHLKDWIKNDPSSDISDIEAIVEQNPNLQLCADLANGSKHLKLTSARVDGKLDSVGVTVNLPIDEEEVLPSQLHYTFKDSSNNEYSLEKLVVDIIDDWGELLKLDKSV